MAEARGWCANDFKGRHFGGEIVLWALRKGQAAMFSIQGGIIGEARIVERPFGIGPCALTEAMTLLQDHLAGADA